jgi:N-acetyl-alpha-D-glucosaminyl L-malate synthase BshA
VSRARGGGAASARPARKPARSRRTAARTRRIGISCYAHFGGSGVVATELGRALARRGFEVHFVAHQLPFRLRSFAANVFFHEANVATYPVFDQPPYNLALATKMVEVAENYRLELMHVHYALPFSASAYLARQVVAPRHLGVVTTLHGTDITVVGAEPAFHRITKFSIESSDRVTAVSEFLRRRTLETFEIARPIEVIYNFVDTAVFTPRRRQTLRLAPARTRVLMHASNFREVKNIPAILQVFAEVRKQLTAKLVMIGDGPEKAGAEKLSRELGIQRDVLFLGNQDCMEELLPLADVFLLPSREESFGLVALEAMSAAVPVVASDVGGIPEVVEDRVTGFLHDPDNVSGMAASVLRLLKDGELRSRMGREARRVARERFDTDAMVDRYVRVYDSL